MHIVKWRKQKKILSTTIFSNYLYHYHHHHRYHIGICETTVNSEIVSRNVHTKTTRSEKEKERERERVRQKWGGEEDTLAWVAKIYCYKMLQHSLSVLCVHDCSVFVYHSFIHLVIHCFTFILLFLFFHFFFFFEIQKWTSEHIKAVKI